MSSADPSVNLQATIEQLIHDSVDIIGRLPDIVEKDCVHLTDALEKKNVVDLAFRRVLSSLTCKTSSDIATESSDVSQITKLLDVAISAAIDGHSNVLTPLNILEDLFDSSTLAMCENIFSCVEQRSHVWKKTPFDKQNCSAKLLRICNMLKKRLSKSQDTVLCGRILMFLASVTPLADQSGVNLSSAFNTSNLTVYDEAFTQAEPSITNPKTMDIDGQVKTGVEVEAVNIEKKVYKSLWGVQKYFAEPNLCYIAGHWNTMQECCEGVLDVFELPGYKLTDQGSIESSIESSSTASSFLEDQQEYFAKYLTSPKLLSLQLADSNFRRQILVQFLILFRYLNNATIVKFKKDSYKLNEKNMAYITKTDARLYQLINESSPSGSNFVSVIKHIMQREVNWVEWKNEKCPSKVFERPIVASPLPSSAIPPPAVLATAPVKSGPMAGVEPKKKMARLDLGSVEMTRLWNQGDNMAACRNPNRSHSYQPEEYLKEAMEQVEPANCVDKEYWAINDEKFNWRSLRLLAKNKLSFFHNSGLVEPLSAFMESALVKLNAEGQGRGDVSADAAAGS